MSRRICVVTGGTKGIGRALVAKFLEQDFHVITCARTEKDLTDLERDMAGKGGKLTTASADLSSKEATLEFGEAVNETGVVDVLVNNTGVFEAAGSILEEAEGSLESMINTNLLSAYHLSRQLVPGMVLRGNGHVFNMCSIASFMAYPNGGSYSITKFALYGMSKVMREELKDKGIRVTSVLPGATLTPSWDGVDLPEERLMKPEDVAEAIWGSYMLSDRTVVEDLVLRPQLGDL